MRVILYILCLNSWSLVIRTIGSMDDMLNVLTLIPSVNDISSVRILWLRTGLDRPNARPFHGIYVLFSRFHKIGIWRREITFQCLFIRFTATNVSTSARASFNSLFCLTWLGCSWDREGNDGIVPNTSKDGTSPLGPIITSIAFIVRDLLLLSSSGCSC